jgi:hypothetical protein
VFGWLQADTVAAVWIAAAAIHREKNTVVCRSRSRSRIAAAASRSEQAIDRSCIPIISILFACLSAVNLHRVMRSHLADLYMQKTG